MSPERRGRRRHKSRESTYPQELEIIRHIYREYDRVVWSAPGYPSEHRPNVESIISRTTVGDHTRNHSRFHLHPDLKPEIRAISEEALSQSREQSAVNNVAVHNLDGSQVFSPTLFRLGHAMIWETVAHEAGHAIAQTPSTISPENYSDVHREIIPIVLEKALQKGKVPPLDQTHIQKLGFREVLRHGDYDISDIGPENCFTLNELYPLTMELVCANLMALKGDVRQFDRNLNEGKLIPDLGGSKREFTNYAYAVMHKIGWRHLLTALKMNDLEQANAYLAALEPEYGGQVILGLAAKYEQDEKAIVERNNLELMVVSILGRLFK